MALRFNFLLEEAGLDPAKVRLIRHQTNLPDRTTPLDLWRADRAMFDTWQSHQLNSQRGKFYSPWWACFLGTREGRTLFAGLYEVGQPELIDEPLSFPVTGEHYDVGTTDRYPLTLSDHLQHYSGRLFVEWGGGPSGKRAWKQRADLQNKIISELHPDEAEQRFPGLMELVSPLSTLMASPPSWIAPLSEARGVYLLTCPRTGELYIGSATGSEGFWQRWAIYGANGHGGNVALIGRDPSDWIVSILQVAGSADTNDDILAMEGLWKRKLQSQAFGLNRNG